ncbi:hypothetical protein SASPL_139651 [Salvia splendens]|uniref:Cyclin C-terminal domain-containing protein n=1 Tax=Salvia splendens TaxID=180675 RepID=A0A8X8WNX1_SALSN|nr:hypothetical protein SASPL_139651 [Salvia splendens]
MKQVSQISLPTLLCGEDESCFDNFNNERFNINCSFSPVSEFDSEYIQMLIRKETIFQSKYSAEIEGIWWKRRDAVERILDGTVHFGYHCRTAYLSLFYLDRFLSRRSVDVRGEAMGYAEINVTDHRPSVVAAAAVLAACDDHHLTNETLEIKIDAVPSWGPVEKEHKLFCYNLLQERVMSKSDDDWMRRSSRKRRVTFMDGDQDCPQPKTPKQ